MGSALPAAVSAPSAPMVKPRAVSVSTSAANSAGAAGDVATVKVGAPGGERTARHLGEGSAGADRVAADALLSGGVRRRCR